ncbi:MAG: protein kinase [Pseudomonadota bacterium]
MSNLIALPAGIELVKDYRVERVLGAGGFGITYLADEIALARSVTIKEYFPSDFAARDGVSDAAPRSQDSSGDYQWGLDRFIEEAQILARFSHPNIVRVYRYFKANNTAYMVLHFEEGQSFKAWLKSLGRAPRQKELDAILAPILDALAVIHEADFLHRDIAPDNIIIRNDGSPVLIDFGSARGEMAGHSKTVSALVKPGYSPYEQYAETSRQQGPWTDIYALAATIYTAIAGRRPPDAPSRVVQDDKPLAKDAALSAYRKRFLSAIDRALSLSIEDRPQSIAEWRGELLAPDEIPAKKSAAAGSSKPGGWFKSGAKSKAPSAANPKAAWGNADHPDLAAIPPRPDEPGRPGGLLDYLDNIKSSDTEIAAALGHDQKPKGFKTFATPQSPRANLDQPLTPPPADADQGPNRNRLDNDLDLKSRPPEATPASRKAAESPSPTRAVGTAKLTSPPVFGFKGFKKKPEPPQPSAAPATPAAEKPDRRVAREKDRQDSDHNRANRSDDQASRSKPRKSWFGGTPNTDAEPRPSKGSKKPPRAGKAVKAAKASKPAASSATNQQGSSALPALRPRSHRPYRLIRTRANSLGSGWRALGIRLAIGIIVAGLAVTYQDRLRLVMTSTALAPATDDGSTSPDARRIAQRAVATPVLPPPAHPRTLDNRTRAASSTGAYEREAQREIGRSASSVAAVQGSGSQKGTGSQNSSPIGQIGKAGEFQSQPEMTTSAPFSTAAITARPVGTPLSNSAYDITRQPRQQTQSPGPSLALTQPRTTQQPQVQVRPETIEKNPLTRVITGHAGGLLALDITADAKTVITSGEDATLRIWTLANGEISRVIALEHGPAVTITTQKTWLATGHRGGFINVYNMETGVKVASFRRNEADIWALAFTTTEGRLAAAAHDWKIALWDIAEPAQPRHVFDAHESAVLSLAISPDGRYMASGGADRRVKLWNLDTLEPTRTYSRQKDFINTLAFSPDGKTLAAGNLRGDVIVGATRTRRLSRRLSGHRDSINAVTFSPAGSVMATASDDGTIRLWDIAKRRTVKTLAGHTDKVTALEFTPSGQELLSVGKDGALRVWSMQAALQ